MPFVWEGETIKDGFLVNGILEFSCISSVTFHGAEAHSAMV